MSITISNYTFEGPYGDTTYLKDASGVYAILCRNNGEYHPIDVGESETVKSRVDNHDRKSCWTRNCSGTLSVAVLYAHDGLRQIIEQILRKTYHLPCGER